MTEQPEIPFILRDMQQAEMSIGRQGPIVFVFVAETHEGDEQPLAREGFPIHYANAKQVGMQIYIQACIAELEDIGFNMALGGEGNDGADSHIGDGEGGTAGNGEQAAVPGPGDRAGNGGGDAAVPEDGSGPGGTEPGDGDG